MTVVCIWSASQFFWYWQIPKVSVVELICCKQTATCNLKKNWLFYKFMKIENFINSYLNILSWKFSKIRRAMFSGITLESGCLFKGCYFCVNSCFASIFGAFQNWILFRNHIYGHVESCKCYYQLWHLDIKLLLPLVPCFSYRFVYLLQLQIIC